MLKKLGITVLAIVMFLSITSSALAGPNAWVNQNYNSNAPGIETNPYKGLMPFSWQGTSAFPHSMEWFYVSLRDVMTGYNTYNWAAIDNELNAISGRGNHAIFRVYLDYPQRPIGTPQFLIDGGLQMRSYTDLGNTTSKAPNWNDNNLVSALERFIAAAGARYDGDNRLGFVQAGLYGFWGEWHTYPHQPDGLGDDWRMSEPNRNRLLTSYKNAFTKTQVVLRDPLGTSDTTLKNSVGYHDDSFAYETLAPTSWHFWPKMTSNGLTEIWKTRSIGGEVRPEIMPDLFNSWPNTVGQDFTTSVNTTHISWLANYWLFDNVGTLGSTEYNNAMRAHKMMGYQFHVSQVKIPDTTASGTLSLDVNIQNRGVAPFPYNWQVEVVLVNSSNQYVASPWGYMDWNLKSIQPGGTNYTKSYTKNNHGLAKGTYTYLLRFTNPLTNGKPLKFANEKMDWNWGGWLTLGNITIN
ncbi:hypothetical protein SY83_21905 [Paenibacillus swuensis]|uniref:DUF4832 domain-containing protein n=1 Tax=Paenibacillus swuensis TaxID=1178515 RepID=A0A172TNV3_9BACL|nr:DUF4832 domain-containing protein [Paenibacillus swuensis]ANE48497.1 hypothetical protein SY83_21905 [Paenibacillus swuensis]